MKMSGLCCAGCDDEADAVGGAGDTCCAAVGSGSGSAAVLMLPDADGAAAALDACLLLSPGSLQLSDGSACGMESRHVLVAAAAGAGDLLWVPMAAWTAGATSGCCISCSQEL
jgi:hypothetical protein